MGLFKKKETWSRKKYNILGIKISFKKSMPSSMPIVVRANALKKFFYSRMGYDLNLANPVTFNEKINWMKLYYRNDLMSKIVDKYEFKNYIKEQLGEGYTVPLLGVWDNVNDIDFDKLPNRFVLKCNAQSDSKFIKIVRDKNELDVETLKVEMQDWLKPEKTLINSFCWAYYSVPLKIIAEEYIEQIDGQVYDYKFMCFNGEPKWVLACSDRGKNTVYENHDIDWNLIIPSPKSATVATINRPKHFDKMIQIAKKLAAPFPFVRVDFYEIENTILLGEMTFYPNGGFNSYNPSYDKKFGDYIKLPEINVKYPFFEKVKNKNKRIINILGKKVLTYRKSLSKNELTKNLYLLSDELKNTKNELNNLKDTLTQIQIKRATEDDNP